MKKKPIVAKQSVCHHIEFVIQQVRQIDEAEARLKRAHRLPKVY